jgi:cytochrome c551/c552
MVKAINLFIISAALGLGIGAVFFVIIHSHQDKQIQLNDSAETSAATAAKDNSKDKAKDIEKSSEKSTSTSNQDSATTVSANQDNIIAKRGCIQCHSVGSLNIEGGQVGPDLSQAYTTVESKHGKPIEEFLKKPTSAVMSGVLGKDPLTDDQLQQVLDLLKKASEVKQ